MHKYVRKDVFAKISTRTSEQEVHAHKARRGGIYTTKDMHPRPKRHTPTLRNRCAGTTQAMLTTPKSLHAYIKRHMHLHKEIHALTQRST